MARSRKEPQLGADAGVAPSTEGETGEERSERLRGAALMVFNGDGNWTEVQAAYLKEYGAAVNHFVDRGISSPAARRNDDPELARKADAMSTYFMSPKESVQLLRELALEELDDYVARQQAETAGVTRKEHEIDLGEVTMKGFIISYVDQKQISFDERGSKVPVAASYPVSMERMRPWAREKVQAGLESVGVKAEDVSRIHIPINMTMANPQRQYQTPDMDGIGNQVQRVSFGLAVKGVSDEDAEAFMLEPDLRTGQPPRLTSPKILDKILPALPEGATAQQRRDRNAQAPTLYKVWKDSAGSYDEDTKRAALREAKGGVVADLSGLAPGTTVNIKAIAVDAVASQALGVMSRAQELGVKRAMDEKREPRDYSALRAQGGVAVNEKGEFRPTSRLSLFPDTGILPQGATTHVVARMGRDRPVPQEFANIARGAARIAA